MHNDIELVRRFLRTRKKKSIYQSARNHLSSVLLRKHPDIYHPIMDSLKELHGANLDKDVEVLMFNLNERGSISKTADRIRQKKTWEKARRHPNGNV